MGGCFRQDNLFTAFRLLWKSFLIGPQSGKQPWLLPHMSPRTPRCLVWTQREESCRKCSQREASCRKCLEREARCRKCSQRQVSCRRCSQREPPPSGLSPGAVSCWSEVLTPGFVVVQSFSGVCLFVTPWIAAPQAALSFTISGSLLKPMSIKSVTPSNHLILCQPLLLPPSIFPSIKIFFSESALWIRWPKYWSFSFLFPMNIGAPLPTEKPWTLPPQEGFMQPGSLALIWNKLWGMIYTLELPQGSGWGQNLWNHILDQILSRSHS